jgi:3',5'-cyclic AMP phosphodiesterase CpdA
MSDERRVMGLEKPFLLAQVSDTHIRARGELTLRRVDTTAMLRACVENILRLEPRPDAVVLTGDLTDDGLPEEYAALRELLAPLAMPLYLIPGNHDDRDALRAAFPDHAYLRQSPRYIQYAIEDYPLRIVAADTLVPGETGGDLCEERLARLDRALGEAPDRPTVVIMHHPPFKTFIDAMDHHGLRNPKAFEQVIRRHPQVEAVLCGHLHRPIEARFAGTVARVAPSCAHQIVLNTVPGAPPQFALEPPAYRLHAYTPETGLVSHTAYIGSYPGPYNFREA